MNINTADKAWWIQAERECAKEYSALVRVLSEQNVGKAHDARLAKARSDLDRAMATLAQAKI